MDIPEIKSFIEAGIQPQLGKWADLGAGSGNFTLALQQILAEGSQIYALDKNPMMLYRIETVEGIKTIPVDADFTQTLDLPPMDGMIMANALHYTADPVAVLKNILVHLKEGGTFLLAEYDRENPIPTWIPFPISWAKFQDIAPQVGLSQPKLLSSRSSDYGHSRLYLAQAFKNA